MNTMRAVTIYTDGSCLGNPGPGGWAALLQLDGTEHSRELSGGYACTTNNRMEIMGVIMGLEALKEPCVVTLVTDSQYVCNAINKSWLSSWQRKNWINSAKKPVKNVDLWKRLIPLLKRHSVRFQWIRGHAGHAQNERCDELARGVAAQGAALPRDAGFDADSRD